MKLKIKEIKAKWHSKLCGLKLQKLPGDATTVEEAGRTGTARNRRRARRATLGWRRRARSGSRRAAAGARSASALELNYRHV